MSSCKDEMLSQLQDEVRLLRSEIQAIASKASLVDLDQLKVLLDHSHREAALTWSRSAGFGLVCGGLVLGSIRVWTNLTGAMTAGECFLLVALSFFGAVVCGFWRRVIALSREMNHVWMDAAAALVERASDPQLQAAFGKPVRMTPSASGRLHSTSRVMELFLLVFVAVWLLSAFVAFMAFMAFL